MKLSPYLFSVATGSLAPSPPWNFRMLTDPAASAAFRGIGLKSVRINAITTLQDIFGGNLQGTPNWSAIQHLVDGFNNSLPNVKLIMVLINHGMYPTNDGTSRGRIANCYVQTAKYLKDHGIRVDYWEVLNEPNFDTPANDVAHTEEAVRSALRAAGDQTPVGGPTASWSQGEYLDASAAAGAEFIDWHAYAKNPQDPVSTDALFDTALNKIGAGGKGPKPWFLTEYNIDSWHDPAHPADPRQQQIEGAIFAALVCIGCAGRDMAATFIWRLENDDGSYGVFYTNTWNLNPVGYLIQAANKYLVPGDIVPFSTGVSAKVVALQSSGPQGKSLMLVNFATQGPSVSVSVPPEYVIRWIQNPTDKHGKVIGGSQVTYALVPPMGVVILTTNVAPAIPDDPDGTIVTQGTPLQANGHSWLINPQAVIAVDGVPDTTTANVVALQSIRPLVVQTNAAGGKWSKQQPSDPWATYTGPTPEPPNPYPPTDVETKAAQWDALVEAMTPLVKEIE